MKIMSKQAQKLTGLSLPGVSNSCGAIAKRIIKLHLAGAMAAAILLAACDVKDPIYNTAHPEHGTITLTTEWDGIGEGLTVPAAYTVATLPAAASAAKDGYTATLNGATNTLDHLFEPGTYRLRVYNTPQHITVDGATVTVAAATGNADGVGQFVQEMPGWLFTGATDIPTEADAEHACTVAMQQQVRQLTLVIEPAGGSTDRIVSIEGRLSGVASTLDMDNGTHAAPQNVALAFAKVTSGADAGKWSATVRLLGVAGNGQKLHATVFFKDNNPAPMPFTGTDSSEGTDLTAELATFNADKRTPLTLGGRMMETPTGAGFTATITDWTPVDGGPVTAE